MKLKIEGIVLIDSNICIFRTLALVEPKIYPRTELDEARDKIHKITNTYKGKIIITDIIRKELQNQQILFQEIYRFWRDKLYQSRLHNVQKMMRQAEKSINKFFLNHPLSDEIKSYLIDYEKNINFVDSFYMKYPEKLAEITKKKINRKSNDYIQKKLSERPNNLPEETDRRLLSQAIELKRLPDSNIYIFSNDSDFKEFREEIFSEWGISIISSDSCLNNGED